MDNMKTSSSPSPIVLGAVAVGILVLVGGGVYASQNNAVKVASSSSSMSASDAMMKKDEDAKMKADEAMKSEEAMKKEEAMKSSTSTDSAMSKEGEVMVKAGSYTDYSSSLLANASTGKVVLFFKASWCPTCNSLDKDITSKLSKIPANTTILKIDYDNSTDLKKKYGITQQHTLVQVDASGNLIKKSVGLPTLEGILSFTI
jgi:thiol-disulfide isomerase/thioredoxin